MTKYPEVNTALDELTPAIQAALRGNLLGIYLRGSLALGDFIPQTSDIDLFVVTHVAVSPEEFETLSALHRSMPADSNPFHNRVEASYLGCEAAARFERGRCYPTLYQGERLQWLEHGANWILERWTVREHGKSLFGPDPRTVVEPVSRDDLRLAVRARLADWAEAIKLPDDPGSQSTRGHKAYVVETMCRSLHTLEAIETPEWRELPSKPQSVAWALRTLPEPWRTTVLSSQSWRTDRTIDPEIVREVQRFVLWAATEGLR